MKGPTINTADETRDSKRPPSPAHGVALLHGGEVSCKILSAGGVLDRETKALCLKPDFVYQNARVSHQAFRFVCGERGEHEVR